MFFTIFIILEFVCFCSTQNDDVEPIVTCPGEVLTSTPSNQATATWATTVTDNIDSDLVATCSPPSGSSFVVGETTVTCSATDSAGNSNSCTFTIYAIRDNDDPILTCSSDIITGTMTTMSQVKWTEPIVTDNLDSGLVATCSPLPGSSFNVGTTEVTCSATDVAGNSGTCRFLVQVIDTGVPNLKCSSNLYVGLAYSVYASVTWSYPVIIDNVDTVFGLTCTLHTAGGLQEMFTPGYFSLGSHTITCTANDTAGNTGSCMFTISVIEDYVTPTIVCPMDILMPASHAVNITWEDPIVSDNTDNDLSPCCTKSAGSLFSIGSTTVFCYSTDTAGNIGNCTFTVTVIDKGENGMSTTSTSSNDCNNYTPTVITSSVVSSVTWILVAVIILITIVLLLLLAYLFFNRVKQLRCSPEVDGTLNTKFGNNAEQVESNGHLRQLPNPNLTTVDGYFTRIYDEIPVDQEMSIMSPVYISPINYRPTYVNTVNKC